ncbi:hypothetical protein ACPWR0_06120 [Pandoraea pneumonica]|uniref:hypothetical protein n=1 Tax=Pandoraea pneumonica TaxID=2508299 RepID=UPI003CEB67A7
MSTRHLPPLFECTDYASFVAGGGALATLAGVDDNDLTVIYRQAAADFAAGRWPQAEAGFRLVATLDVWHYEAWLSLGHCLGRRADYRNALFCFIKAGIVRPSEPQPPFYAAQAYVRLGRRDEALTAFAAALRQTGDRDDYQGLRRAAREQIDTLTRSTESVT